jgi:hypothetical protein
MEYAMRPPKDVLQTLIDQIEAQIVVARKRNHLRLVDVLIDAQCIVRRYRSLYTRSVRECA